MADRTKQPGWEHFPHQADIGIRGRGRTKEEAFEQAAVALTAVITEPDKVECKEEMKISCNAPDDELLLVDWLNRLLYEISVGKMLFGRFDVKIKKGFLNASAWGEKIDIAKHNPTVEVKAATYTSLKVGRDKDGDWVAQCIVDV